MIVIILSMISSQFLQRLTLLRDKVESFQSYPFNIPVVRDLDCIEFHPKVTFFVGENGSGKSTLMEAIAVSLGFNPEGGSKNFNFNTRASHSLLSNYLRLSKGYKKPRSGYFFRAESYFNLATEIERLDSEPGFGPPVISYYGNRSLHEQSHGESFMALLMNRFGYDGLYILDEPEAALSPQRQLAVLPRLHELVNENCQFVIATHSPILLAYPDAWIYQLVDGEMQKVEYRDTEHYQVMHDFLMDPERSLRVLLQKD